MRTSAQIIVCCVCALASLAEGAEQLRFRFQPGDRFYLVSVDEQTTTQVVDGNQQVISQTIRLRCDLDIDEVEENGCAWAKYTYGRVAMKITGPSTKVEFDSGANQQKVPSQAMPLAVVVGEEFYVKITPQGRIDKINGLQSVAGSAKAKVPNTAGRNQVVQAIDSQFAEAVVKRELEDRLAVFPDLNAVTGPASARSPRGEAGDPCLVTPPSAGRGDEERVTTWSRTEQIDEEKIVVERTFRFKERMASGDTPGGITIIEVNVVVRPAADVDETVRGGVRMRREISGQGAGQIEIDEPTGRIINERLVQDSIEEIKAFSEGQVRRIPPIPEPTRTHTIATFQMIKRDSEKPPASPPPGGVEGSQPDQSAPSKVEEP